MSKIYLSLANFIVGQPVRWNIYSEDEQIVLKAGESITSEQHWKTLSAQKLHYKESDAIEAGKSAQGLLSVVRMINQANKMLRETLPTLRKDQDEDIEQVEDATANKDETQPAETKVEYADMDAESTISMISQIIYGALELNPDIALATIFLNQGAMHYAFHHPVNCAIIAGLMTRAMNQPVEDILATISAALTANVGMLELQIRVSNKTTPLSPKERAAVLNHPQKSVDILKEAGVKNEAWLSYVLCHHENEDGSGYPSKKKGDEIPLNSNIIGFADRYCARVTSRGEHRSALPADTVSDLLLEKQKEFKSQLAPHFIKLIGIHPPGIAVLLKSGEIAIVLKQGTVPGSVVARVAVNSSEMPVQKIIVRETQDPQYAIVKQVHKDTAGANLHMSRFWGQVASA
ncbi:MAG TPA: HD domain-containing phosphohydrolase [Methylophilaceae bacterium]|jgi:HD-GYP domain-containing protein (c-di-GMP phosphodiesterase class II)